MEFIHDAALKMFKIHDSTTLDSIDDEDEMDYLSESSGGQKLIGSALVKQQIVIGLHVHKWD